MSHPRPCSSPPGRRPARGWGFALALCLIAAPAPGQTWKSARGDVLLAGADGRRLLLSRDGGRVELPLAEAARVSDLRSVGDAWIVAATGRGPEGPTLELLRGRGAGVESLGSPALAPVAQLDQPVFAADSRRLHGLVWLAGEAHHRLAVEASLWIDGRWAAPETVSPPGPGTQTALTAAVLADGSWLVAWAAFDGRDDEVLWSRRVDGVWSKPRPIAEDNAVPDITPHLFPTASGALVAWSRYDGNDYRVNVARFDGESWSRPRPIGPRGSTAPTFASAPAPYLIHHRADPPAWAVQQLDRNGRVLRQAAVETAQAQQPVLGAVSEEGVALDWPALGGKTKPVPLLWAAP